VELGVHAAEVVGPAEVRALDLRAAHRQRFAIGPNSTEARGSGFGFAEQIEVDLDPEHLLHAADVRSSRLLERIEERAGPLDAGTGVDDLVAVNPAATALDLVLWPERKLPGRASDLA
jgi:hypothetical protein